MSDIQSIKEAFDYLKSNKYFRNQQDFVERIGSDKATVSQILSGKKTYDERFVCKIVKAFPVLNEKWFNGESDEMLSSSKNIVEEPKEKYDRDLVLVELNDVVKNQREIIMSQQSTINKLTEMLYEMNKK